MSATETETVTETESEENVEAEPEEPEDEDEYEDEYAEEHTLPDWLLKLDRQIVGFDQAMEDMGDFNRVKNLGFSIAAVMMTHAKLLKTMEEDEDTYCLERVKTKLAERNEVTVNQFDMNVLRGLEAEKRAHEEKQRQLLEATVREKVAAEERFMQVEFETKMAAEHAAEASRHIERVYLAKRAELLKCEIASQRRLIMTVTRAAVGDATQDEVDKRHAEQRAAVLRELDWKYEKARATLKRNAAAAQLEVAEAVNPCKRVKTLKHVQVPAGFQKAARGAQGDGPTDGDSDPEDTPETHAIMERARREAAASAQRQRALAEEAAQMFGLAERIDLELWEEMKDPGWRKLLEAEARQPYFRYLNQWLLKEHKERFVFPRFPETFRAFNLCPLHKVKVVIIGQDPYHKAGEANGLAFSVNRGVKVPPSLANIYKELRAEYKGFKIPKHGDLARWAENGVLLLNSILTSECGKALGHARSGWTNFTDVVVKQLNERPDPVVFMLWGNYAKKKCFMINKTRHRVIECAHPSPLSFHKWTGSKPFSRCNAALTELKKTPVNWTDIPQ